MNPVLLLRFGLGIVLLGFGIDQLRNYKPWNKLVPKALRWTQLPSVSVFWRIHATLNVVLGVLLMFGYMMEYVTPFVSLWLLIISLATFSTNWRVALRDLGLTAASIALWMLL